MPGVVVVTNVTLSVFRFAKGISVQLPLLTLRCQRKTGLLNPPDTEQLNVYEVAVPSQNDALVVFIPTITGVSSGPQGRKVISSNARSLPHPPGALLTIRRTMSEPAAGVVKKSHIVSMLGLP